MAIISMLFSTKAIIGKRGDIGDADYLPGLELDCSLSEKHEATAKLTQLPIEDGSTISDNIILDPLKLQIEGVISKTPLGLTGLLGSVAGAGAGLVGKSVASKFGQQAGTAALTASATIGGLVAKSLTDGVDGPKSREPSDVWDFLLELQGKRVPFDVVTALKVYQTMVITNLSTTRNKDTTGALAFTAQFEQVRIVAPIIGMAQISAPGAAPASNLGKQATTSPAAKTGEAGASWLSHITGIGA